MLQVNVTKLGELAVVVCDGAIIYGEEAALLRQTVKDALRDTRHIVLDLAAVRSMDSNGLGTLVGLLTSAEAAGGEVKLAALGPRVKDVLMIAKLTSLFHIYGSVQEAVEAFRLESTPIAVGELGG